MITKSAGNRRAAYDQRVAVATTEQAKVHALVWWWMAEIKRLPAEGRAEAIGRLERATADLNERKAS